MTLLIVSDTLLFAIMGMTAITSIVAYVLFDKYFLKKTAESILKASAKKRR